MKFGKTLLQNQIPEWSKNYVSYKALKKSINEASSHNPPTEEAITAIFFQLDRELEKVNTFYAYKQSQVDRRLWILSEKYHQYYPAVKNNSATSPDVKEELVSALQETRAQINRIMWYAELNTKGFRKILKKLDKKLGLETQTVYWQTKVSVLPFVSHARLRSEVEKLTKWISTLSPGDDRSLTREPTIRHPASVSVKMPQPSTIGRHGSVLTDEENMQLANLIEKDDANAVAALLEAKSLNGKSKKEADQTGYALLELATQRGSLECLEYLIKHIVTPLNHRDINDRNLLHKLCILAGENSDPGVTSAPTLSKLLELAPNLALQQDFARRRPLHYACEFGQAQAARLLLEHAKTHGHYKQSGFAEGAWQDREGHTPFFLAILHGNHETLDVLIDVGHVASVDGVFTDKDEKQPNGSNILNQLESVPEFARFSHHPSSVALACSIGNDKLLRLLISKGAAVDLADEDGETALHIAVRKNFVQGVRSLIEYGHANVNLAEKINAWTPLMVAAIEGCTEIAQILLDAGADKTPEDHNGWAAYEHAVFRGYLDIGRMTKPEETKPFAHTSSTVLNGDSKTNGSHITKARSRASRLYGHKYLTDESMIIITLGSNDIRNALSQCFVQLDKTLSDERRLSIAISAKGAYGDVPIIDLPTDNEQHLQHPEPIVLFASKPEDIVLRFDVVETFGSTAPENVLARGTAVLATDQIFTKSRGFQGRVSGNSSLRGAQNIPLIQASTLEYIGTLGFEYVVVTPFEHPKMTVGDRYTYYKSLDTKIIGHRGSGMNKREAQLQVGENTVLSFITAASLGAEYIEFDVQLTKDLVPVIYHDWTVTESGFDIPLNAITSEQFLNLRPSGHIKEYHTGVSDGVYGEVLSTSPRASANESIPDHSHLITTASSPSKRMNRSHSVGSIDDSPAGGRFSRRQELTRTNKLGKLKGNGPESIQAPFTTLAEALKKIPKSAGCNIEVKYPMVDEAEGDELHQFQELNIFVDTILNCVYDHIEEDRRIIFSSFHPEVCLFLNLKQPNYPVFFLTDAGTLPMADIRCNSLQGAVRFAKQADLLGIVSASEPILQAPRMCKVIKESGLLLFTYGVLNNEVENAVAQKNYGVDAVIVDSVLAVRKGLRGETQTPPKIQTPPNGTAVVESNSLH